MDNIQILLLSTALLSASSDGLPGIVKIGKVEKYYL